MPAPEINESSSQPGSRSSRFTDLPPHYRFFLLMALIVLMGFAIWNHTVNGEMLYLFITTLLK
jgi:hypothetical protein